MPCQSAARVPLALDARNSGNYQPALMVPWPIDSVDSPLYMQLHASRSFRDIDKCKSSFFLCTCLTFVYCLNS